MWIFVNYIPIAKNRIKYIVKEFKSFEENSSLAINLNKNGCFLVRT